MAPGPVVCEACKEELGGDDTGPVGAFGVGGTPPSGGRAGRRRLDGAAEGGTAIRAAGGPHAPGEGGGNADHRSDPRAPSCFRPASPRVGEGGLQGEVAARATRGAAWAGATPGPARGRAEGGTGCRGGGG